MTAVLTDEKIRQGVYGGDYIVGMTKLNVIEYLNLVEKVYPIMFLIITEKPILPTYVGWRGADFNHFTIHSSDPNFPTRVINCIRLDKALDLVAKIKISSFQKGTWLLSKYEVCYDSSIEVKYPYIEETEGEEK